MRVSVRSAYWTSSSVLRRYVAPGVFLSPKSGRRSHTSASMERPYRFQAIRVSRLFQYYTVEAFWQEVEEGGYEFMASRPLDLGWMTKQWMVSQKLGTYTELIETAVTHRLREPNQSYIDSGAVLSPAQLREGAEQMAAVCTFAGYPYVSVPAVQSID